MSSGKNLRNGWLVVLGLVAFYAGLIRPHESSRGVNNSKAAGLSVDSSTVGRVRSARGENVFHQRGTSPYVSGVVGGVPGGIANGQAGSLRRSAYLSLPASSIASQDADKSGSSENDEDRKVVRSSYLELEVAKPDDAEKIRGLASRCGGFLVTSEMRGDRHVSSASLTIRVPAVRYEEVRAEIRKLARRVASEKIEAQDVTRQYVDQAANLRNLRAEESHISRF